MLSPLLVGLTDRHSVAMCSQDSLKNQHVIPVVTFYLLLIAGFSFC